MEKNGLASLVPGPFPGTWEMVPRPFLPPPLHVAPPDPYTPHPDREPAFVRNHGWLFSNERKRLLASDLYDGEIRYFDDGFSKLVTSLQQMGLWDDALVVITSDHGEEFYEHGVLGHG